jgi:hypothetical protein
MKSKTDLKYEKSKNNIDFSIKTKTRPLKIELI